MSNSLLSNNIDGEGWDLISDQIIDSHEKMLNSHKKHNRKRENEMRNIRKTHKKFRNSCEMIRKMKRGVSTKAVLVSDRD